MFTGIIETVGEITNIEKDKENIIFTIQSEISDALKIDQSVSHDGVCLTVTAVNEKQHQVCAIQETLKRSHLANKKVGDLLNLERCMKADGRLDGHFVYGHVDTMGTCISKEDKEGSWEFHFEYEKQEELITVEKGSIAINGVSLTVVESGENTFSVAIIPYTYEHTTFAQLEIGDKVNLEFDIIGKYLKKYLSYI